jgi:hypothetical protein
MDRTGIYEAASLLARAFEGDPLMEALLTGTQISPERAREELYRLSCLVRIELS